MNEKAVMNKIVKTIEAADILTVLGMLPHRYPFLMVDRVIDIRGDEHGIGIKNVTFNEPHFQGHFPGNPVFPGVLMIEGMAQTAGVLCVKGGWTRTGAEPRGTCGREVPCWDGTRRRARRAHRLTA